MKRRTNKNKVIRYSPFTCYGYFTCSHVFHRISDDMAYIKTLSILRSKNCVLNFTAVIYSLPRLQLNSWKAGLLNTAQ